MAIDYLRLPERKTVRRPYGQWPHSAGSQIAKGFAGGAQQMSRNYFQDRAMDQRDRELARREAEDAELAQRRGATSNYINRREAGFQPTGRVDNWLMPDLQGSGSTAGADPGVVNKYETGRDRRAKSRREMEKELVEFTMEQAQQEAMWVLDAVNQAPTYDVLKQNLNAVAAQTPNMPEVTDEVLAKKGINAQTYAADRPKIQAQQQSIIDIMKKQRTKREEKPETMEDKLEFFEGKEKIKQKYKSPEEKTTTEDRLKEFEEKERIKQKYKGTSLEDRMIYRQERSTLETDKKYLRKKIDEAEKLPDVDFYKPRKAQIPELKQELQAVEDQLEVLKGALKNTANAKPAKAKKITPAKARDFLMQAGWDGTSEKTDEQKNEARRMATEAGFTF